MSILQSYARKLVRYHTGSAQLPTSVTADGLISMAMSLPHGALVASLTDIRVLTDSSVEEIYESFRWIVENDRITELCMPWMVDGMSLQAPHRWSPLLRLQRLLEPDELTAPLIMPNRPTPRGYVCDIRYLPKRGTVV